MRSGAWLWVSLALVGCTDASLGFDAPDTLEFGDVGVGVEGTQRLIITNLTDDDDVLTLTAPEGFSVAPAIAVLAPRARLEVVVRSRPTALGPQEGLLLLNTRKAARQVALHVRGVGPRIGLGETVSLPAVVLLDEAQIGTTAGVLRVSNVGTAGTTLRFVTPETDDDRLCVGPCNSRQEWSVNAGTSIELPVTLIANGAENRSWTITVHSNDAIEPVRSVRVVVLIAHVVPCAFQLNSVLAVGANGTVVRLQHHAPSPCFLRTMGLDVMPSDSLRFEPDSLSFPRLVQAGEVITRTLKPNGPSPFLGGTLRIQFEGGQDDVVLTPTTNPNPCLTFIPTRLEFGTSAGACTSTSRSVFISNQCETPVVLTGASTSSADFEVTQFTPNVEVRAGGPPALVAVRFVPHTAGTLSGTLNVATSATELLVPLAGLSTPPRRQVDRFFRDVLPTAKALFLVDTSPSFGGERARVRGELAAMLRRASTACVDLGVALAPAEGAGPVSFALNDAGAVWTSNQQPDFVARALGAFDALPASSETEACIGPAAQLMAGLPDAGTFSGFCFTDALEQTPDAGGALTDLRAQHRFVSWNAVTGTPSSTCAVEARDDDLAHRSLVTATGGISADVCGPFNLDFQTGTAGFPCGPRTVYFLTGVPVGPPEVRLDGQLVPSTEWTFDAAQNAVVFQPRAAPPPGSTLEISYDLPCT